MSTQYYFADPDKEQRIAHFQAQVKEIGEQARAMINALAIGQDLEDLKDTFLSAFDDSHVFEVCAPDDDHLTIGTARMGGFSWRRDNGFHDMSSIERYLNQHPNMVIADEYGIIIPLKDFQKIVQGLRQP